MSYLAIARSIVTGYERNEIDEKTPRLSPEDAEQLKAAIIDAATVESARFDRAEFDRLWALWLAHEAAGGTPWSGCIAGAAGPRFRPHAMTW